MRLVNAMLLACVLGLAPAGYAFGQAQDPPGVVSTRATSRKRLTNTVADVVFGVEARARTIASVHKTLADSSKALLDFLRTIGAERLRTDQVSVTPETETDRGRGLPDRIVGYTARMQVSFRVPADKLPEVLAGVLDRGGNTLLDTVLTPREEELDAARQELAAAATRTAMAQADAIAQAAGRKLGKVRSITVESNPGYSPRPPMAAASMAAPRPAGPIAAEAGESELANTVSVVVTLIEP